MVRLDCLLPFNVLWQPGPITKIRAAAPSLICVTEPEIHRRTACRGTFGEIADYVPSAYPTWSAECGKLSAGAINFLERLASSI